MGVKFFIVLFVGVVLSFSLLLMVMCILKISEYDKVSQVTFRKIASASLDDISGFLCVTSFLQETQSCHNPNKYFMTVSSSGGPSHGIGSQFNYFLIFSLISAMIRGQRMVLVLDRQIPFEFECPEKGGWSCYLTFPCIDSVMDLDKEGNIRQVNVSSLTSSDRLFKRGSNGYGAAIMQKYRGNNGRRCSDLSSMLVTSLAAKHLYNLNNKTAAFERDYNGLYIVNTSTIPYFSVHLRSTDKATLEMDYSTFSWLMDSRHLVKLIREVRPVYGTAVQHVFVASDNCTYAENLASQLALDKLIAFGPCIQSSFKSTVSSVTGRNYEALIGRDPHRGMGRDNHQQTLRFFAEIEMLVRGVHFFGYLGSNVARLVHRLRYPRGWNGTTWFCSHCMHLSSRYTATDFPD